VGSNSVLIATTWHLRAHQQMASTNALIMLRHLNHHWRDLWGSTNCVTSLE